MDVEVPRDLKVLPPPDYSEIDPRLLEEIHKSDERASPSQAQSSSSHQNLLSSSHQNLLSSSPSPSSSNSPLPSPPIPSTSTSSSSSSSHHNHPKNLDDNQPFPPQPPSSSSSSSTPTAIPHPLNPSPLPPSSSSSLSPPSSSHPPPPPSPSSSPTSPPPSAASPQTPQKSLLPPSYAVSNPLLPVHRPGHSVKKGENTPDSAIKGEAAWAMNIVFFLVGGGVGISFAIILICCVLALLILPFPAVRFLLQESYFIFPYGRKAVWESKGITFKRVVVQILWTPFFLIFAFLHGFFGCFFCLTIIGIPIGFQHFALVNFYWNPFEAKIQSRPLSGRDLFSKEYFLDPK